MFFFSLLSSKCLKTVFTRHNAISVTAPPPEYKLQTFSLRGKRQGGRGGGERGEGSGLTIAAWADINLSKLMEVSIMLCYGWGDVKDPWIPPLVPLTPCFHANNSKSVQPAS